MMSSMPPNSSDKDEVCKGYTKKFFSYSSSKSEEILELIHSDICE
jgi:hypothetical protein